jgi:hypothetical protein
MSLAALALALALALDRRRGNYSLAAAGCHATPSTISTCIWQEFAEFLAGFRQAFNAGRADRWFALLMWPVAGFLRAFAKILVLDGLPQLGRPTRLADRGRLLKMSDGPARDASPVP